MTATIQPQPAGRKKLAKLLDAVAAAQESSVLSLSPGNNTVQATVSGTGSVSASILIEYSNDGIGWIPAGTTPTILLAGTTLATDGFVISAEWIYIRANLLTISGTNALVTVAVGML